MTALINSPIFNIAGARGADGDKSTDAAFHQLQDSPPGTGEQFTVYKVGHSFHDMPSHSASHLVKFFQLFRVSRVLYLYYLWPFSSFRLDGWCW